MIGKAMTDFRSDSGSVVGFKSGSNLAKIPPFLTLLANIFMGG